MSRKRIRHNLKGGILNPDFEYTSAAHTNVGRHLEAFKREQRRLAKLQVATVTPIKRKANG